MNTRKKVIKIVYKDEEDSDAGGDFSDSGSEASISEHSASSEEDVPSEAEASEEEVITKPTKKILKQRKLTTKPPIVRNAKFAKAFISKIKQTSSFSDDEEGGNVPTFSVKDLTEADKLLPPVLNLSDSDSSDDDLPKPSTSANNISATSYTSQNYESDSDKETNREYTDIWSKNIPDNSEEIAKQKFLELEKHKNKLEEAKASVEKYNALQNNAMEVDVNTLLAQGEELSPKPAIKLKKSTRNKKKQPDSDSEIEDWEEVDEKKVIPQQGIQLVVDFPDGAKKSKKLDVEMMMKRKINRVKKEYQVYMHNVHVLCWLGHGNYVSQALNDQMILAAVLTLIPSKECYPGDRINIAYVEQITTWYKNKLTLKQDKHEDKFHTKAPPLKDTLISSIKTKTVKSKKHLVYIFISLLRALGLQCRVMFNFVTLPIKPPSSELCSLSTKPKEKGAQVKDEQNKSSQKKNDSIKKSTKTTSKHTKSKATLSQVDGQDDDTYSEDDDLNFMQVDGSDDPQDKSKGTKTRSKRSKAVSKVEKENDDVSPPKMSKLDPKPKSSPAGTSINANRKSRSTNKNKQLPEPPVVKDDKDLKTEKKSTASTSLETLKKNVKEIDQKSPRKTRQSATKAVTDPKQVTKTKKGTIKANDAKKVPEIVVTDENKTNVSSSYFQNNATSQVTKKLSLSRKRSVTATPSQDGKEKTKVISEHDKPKARTRSAPEDTSKYFPNKEPNKKPVNRKQRQKEDILEDAQRVSHKDLHKKAKPKNDVRKDLVNIIKSRVKEAKIESTKGIVKGKIKKESDEDSDYLPEENTKKHNSGSDEDFKPSLISPKPQVKRKVDRRVLSSEESEVPKRGMDVWCEVYVEELEQWISVDVIKAKVHCSAEIYKQATHPVAYIVGWDNSNYLKDLTRRYVPHWNTVTRKIRVESSWWAAALRPWLGPNTARDREENDALDRMQLEAPLPKTISEYKNHPLYALKRHLLKYEALYPADAATLGFVRGEPVYARECVHVCRSRDTWLKEAKVVKMGEKPYKIVKARPKWDKLSNRCINDLPLEIFGPWQIQDYEPPTAENGIVPRNAYGNVELFKACMLPKGTVHIKLPGLNRVAKKLNVDCAPAMTGFDFNGGFTHPVFDGFVVCKEFEEILTEAWVMDQEEQERKEIEKLETRVYGNWKRLIKGLLIRERLKDKYGFQDPSTSKNDKKKSKGPRLIVKKGS